MDGDWLTVSEAAEELLVDASEVRRLIAAGQLAGVRRAGRWLVDPRDVQRRGYARPGRGRPLSPGMAWLVLAALSGSGSRRGWSTLSRGERFRLRGVLEDLPDDARLAALLRKRAAVRRIRAHPGVVDRLLDDPRVHVGGAQAVVASGADLTAGGRPVLYIAEPDFDGLARDFRLADDPAGNVDVAVIPDSVDADLLPRGGEPVPAAVAWVDLLDDLDSRARSAAHDWLRRQRATVAAEL